MSYRSRAIVVGSLALVLLVPVAARGQESSTQGSSQPGSPVPRRTLQNGIGIGAMGGPVFASLSQPNVSWGSGKGATGGVFIDAKGSGALSFVAEVLYSQKGAANLGRDGHLYFIQVPALVRIGTRGSSPNRVRLYGLAGPSFDFNFKATPGLGGIRNYNAVDVNAVAGFGVEIAQLIVEARENIGLRELQPNTPNLMARTFVLMFGVRFR